MPTNHPRWSRCAASLLLLSLGACGLPAGGERPHSTALTDTGHTSLAAVVQSRVAAHPGQSGLHPLADGRDAIAARLALADAAERSLDVQYFIWNQDLVGRTLMARLLRAADRGVRVRILLDDLGTEPADPALLALNSHPRIEVRLFNPANLRSPRNVGILVDINRLNRRMHNKSFTADGQVAIVGGRNIGDEYFGADKELNFADLDVALVGPAVKQVGSEFDDYWNHPTAVPITRVVQKRMTADELAQKRTELFSHAQTTEDAAYAATVQNSEFARQLRRRDVSFYWGRATIVNDRPDKVLIAKSKTETHLAPQLREVVDRTHHELFLVSPYFVPGQQGVDLLAGVHARGARVLVLTNSLAATDGIPVHAKYQLYRKRLLQSGVELYEIKPTATGRAGKNGGFFATSLSAGSHNTGLHAKTFSFDRRTGFIGSYNLDPRSQRLNTEMGVIFDCPQLAKQLPEQTERDLARNTYKLELEGNDITWVAHEAGKEVRFHSEPEAGFMKKAKVRVISWLPIESLL